MTSDRVLRFHLGACGLRILEKSGADSGQSVEPVIVPVDGAVMEQSVGQTVEVAYRDWYGEFVSASGIWLLWRS